MSRGQEGTAAPVSVTAAADSSHITIGDWFHYTVTVRHLSGVTILWKQNADSLGSCTIVQQDSVSKGESNGVVTEQKSFTLSKYNAGTITIPPFAVGYASTGDTAIHTAESQPITIQVATVAVDTTQGIKDIKPPLGLPWTLREIATYVGILLLVCALAYLIYYYVKKRKQQEKILVEEKPAVPPDVAAIIHLRELEAERVWQRGEVKLFYSKATEILRSYFEGRFGITALEMTTDEIMSQFQDIFIDEKTRKEINAMLTSADFVKFAKFNPSPTDNDEFIPRAIKVVEATKPVVAQETPVRVHSTVNAENPAAGGEGAANV
ncbi:MAG: hypothetical protein KGJ59_11740 [Bacteroidota bacterium]|nr:hypothetical protein [Bacteroidota bacterium]